MPNIPKSMNKVPLLTLLTDLEHHENLASSTIIYRNRLVFAARYDKIVIPCHTKNWLCVESLRSDSCSSMVKKIHLFVRATGNSLIIFGIQAQY